MRSEHTGIGLEVRILGSFCVLSDGREIPVPGAVGRLVAFLAVAGSEVGRERAAGTLAPDVTMETSLQRLRSALWKASKLVPDLIAAGTSSLRLAPGTAVDLSLARSWAESLWSGEACAETIPVDLFTNDVLADWYEPWAVAARHAFAETRVRVLETIARQRLEAGKTCEAIEPCVRAIATDPIRESPHRLLVEINLAEGNPGSALAHIAEYRRLLAHEMGAKPSSMMTDLEHSILGTR